MIAVARRCAEHNESSSMEQLEAARRLYCDTLGGRSIAPADADGALWFLVGGVLVETGRKRGSHGGRVVLPMDDPEGVAARCWNAGYTVVVDDVRGLSIAVIDPFGVRLELMAERVRQAV